MVDQFTQFAQGAGQYIKKSFGERLKDTGYLFKHSFLIASRAGGVKRPTVHMAIFAVINRSLFFGSLLTIFLGQLGGWPWLALFFAMFVLVPFRIFYDVRQKADQSWMVYNAIRGRATSYKEAHAATRLEKTYLRKIAFVDLLMRYAGRQRSGKKGLAAALINLFIAALVEVWDLLQNYMIPAVVIEDKSIREIIPQIKALRANVPATLAGVFGIDFAGGVVRTIFAQIYFLAIVLALGAGYLFQSYLGDTVTPVYAEGTRTVLFSTSWLPLFLAIWGVSLISGVFVKLVESFKIIYFTIFYTSIMRPQEIAPEIRGEVTNYLLMQEKSSAQI